MSLSTLKLATFRIPPAIGENGSHPNAPKVTLINRQALPAVKVQIKSIKEMEQPLLQERSAVSFRREMMHLTAVTLCFAPLFFPATAEARPRNATVREKAKEKLGELKEKAGLAKPKDEGKGNEPKDNEAKKSKPTNEIYGSKAKSKDDVAGTNPGAASRQTPAQAPEKEASGPTPPTLPPLTFLTGRNVETSVS